MIDWVRTARHGGRSRHDWQYDHVTEPRAAWHEGEAGARRVASRRLRALLIGAETRVGSYRIERTADHQYSVFCNYTAVGQCRTPADVLAVIFDRALPAGAPTGEYRKSQYRGVYWRAREGKWAARIGYQTREIRLGTFTTEEAAAAAYDAFVLEHNLDRPLNLPQERAA